MLRIKLICVGKAKGDWVAGATEHYRKLLGRSCKLEIIEIPESKSADGSVQSLKAAEGSAIVSRLGEKLANQQVWTLDINGESFSSEEFAERLQREMNSGVSELILVIGGAYGLAESISHSADLRFSLSTLTLSHQVARVTLLEQLYRAFSILAGTAYHK